MKKKPCKNAQINIIETISSTMEISLINKLLLILKKRKMIKAI